MLSTCPDTYYAGGGTHCSDLYSLGAKGEGGEEQTVILGPPQQEIKCRHNRSHYLPPLRVTVIDRGLTHLCEQKSKINLSVSRARRGEEKGGARKGGGMQNADIGRG